jgi:hypothetical protein
MAYTKTNKILEAISELYSINDLTISDFNKLSYEQKVIAILWCSYTNNHLSSLTPHTLNQLKTTLTNLEVKLKDKIVIENIDTLALDLNELDNVISINTIITKLNELTTKLNTLTTIDYTSNLTTLNNSVNDITNYTNNLNNILLKLDELVPIDYNSKLDTVIDKLNLVDTNNLLSSLLSNNYKIDTTSLDYLAFKLQNLDVNIHSTPITYSTLLSNTSGTAQTLSTPAREVGSLNVASYLVVVTGMSTNNLPTKVEGSIDGTNWTTVPLKYSNLSGNSNHVYTIPNNGTYLFSTEILTRYIRLTVANIVTAKVNGQLYVK